MVVVVVEVVVVVLHCCQLQAIMILPWIILGTLQWVGQVEDVAVVEVLVVEAVSVLVENSIFLSEAVMVNKSPIW